jgi:hypothetical protein
MAFGDSLTEGKISSGERARRLLTTTKTSCGTKLAARYELQTITMVKEAQSGEPTGEGKWRFEPAFNQANPQVVLLLEGHQRF